MIALGLNLLSVAIYVSAAAATGYPTGLGVPGLVTCSPSGGFVTGTAGAYSGLTTLAGALGIIAFILVIVAWIRWRSSVRALDESGSEYGPEHAREAEEARKFYGYTLYSYVFLILAEIVGVAILTSVIVGVLLSGLTQNGTGTSLMCTQALADQLNHQIVQAVVALGLVSAISNLLVYYFATRSFVGGIRSISSEPIRARLELGRRLTLIGVLLLFGTPLVLVTVLAQFLALGSGILIIIGYLTFHSAYGDWLIAPPPPAAPASPPPSSYSYPAPAATPFAPAR